MNCAAQSGVQHPNDNAIASSKKINVLFKSYHLKVHLEFRSSGFQQAMVSYSRLLSTCVTTLLLKTGDEQLFAEHCSNPDIFSANKLRIAE